MTNAFTACNRHAQLVERWELIDDLLGGTLQMVKKGIRWLPQEPKEENDKYAIRLSRSVLFEAFKDASGNLARKPFSKPVEVSDLPPQLKYFEEEVDRSGTSLTSFCRQGFYHGVTHGASYILVDSPKVGTTVNRQEAEDQKIRPYLSIIHPRDVIDKVYTQDTTGKRVLTAVRIKSKVRNVDVNFLETFIDECLHIQLIGDKCIYTRYRIDSLDLKKTVQFGDPITVNIPFIPLFMTSFDDNEPIWPNPPLEGLGWLNLAHFQSTSDQRNILRIARSGLLLLKGLTNKDMEKDIVFGPNYVLKTTSDVADGKFIEHGGKAMEAGEVDIKNLETRMELLGLSPLIQKSARVAATSRAIDQGKTESTVHAWVYDFADTVKQAINAAAHFFDNTPKSDVQVSIFSNFGVSVHAQFELDTLVKARAQGDLSLEAFLHELQRRTIISEDLDVKKEAAAAQAESRAREEFRQKMIQKPALPPKKD